MALFMFGCAPSYHADTNFGAMTSESMSEEGLLSTTSTGQQVLEEIELIRSRGYSIQYERVSGEFLQSMGAKWSAHEVSDRTLRIYIHQDLNLKDRVHAISHEISRAKDQFDIEDYLRNHPEMSDRVNEFWDLYEEKGMSGFDWKVIRFAVGVAACKEVHAFVRNRNLSDEGIRTEKYQKGESVGSYLDEVYFSRFELSLKRLIAKKVVGWCEKYSTMADLQESLSWD